MNKKVSIIIPVYNVEKYIRQCLDSILQQTLKDIEIIIIDDGSTDNSKEIVDEYQSLWDNVMVFHKENGGQGSARNVGLQYATGEYIYFMDSDDYLEKNALESLYEEAHSKKLDILLFGAVIFTEEDALNDRMSQFAYSRIHCLNSVMSGKEAFCLTYPENEYVTSVCLRFYNRMFLERINLKFADGIIHEDEDFGVLSYVKADRVEIINENFYNRRLRSGSTMIGKTPKKSIEGYFYAWEKVRAFYDLCKWDNDKKDVLLQLLLSYFFNINAIYCNAKKSERKECKRILLQLKDNLKMMNLRSVAWKERLMIRIFIVNIDLLYCLVRIRMALGS